MSVILRGVGGKVNTFLPSDLSSLILWTDASVIAGLSDGGAVSSWTDQSGNGNTLLQTTAGERPTYRTNIQNSRPVVRFASNDYLTVGSSINLLNECSFIAAISFSSANAQDPIFSKGAGDLTLVNWDGANAGLGLAESGVAFIAFDGAQQTTAFQVVELTWDGSLGANSEAFIYRNGTQVATGTYNVGNLANGAALDIGKDGAVFLDGDVGELIIYQRVLSAGQRTQVRGYLNARWGL